MKWTPEKIRELRRRFDESQVEFGERLGVNQQTVSMWEKGDSRPVGPARILLDRLEEDAKSIKHCEPISA